MKVTLAFEYLAYRVNNRISLETGCGNLIKQWLESVIVVFVDQNHLNRSVGEPLSQFQASETTANDNHPGLFDLRNIYFHFILFDLLPAKLLILVLACCFLYVAY